MLEGECGALEKTSFFEEAAKYMCVSLYGCSKSVNVGGWFGVGRLGDVLSCRFLARLDFRTGGSALAGNAGCVDRAPRRCVDMACCRRVDRCVDRLAPAALGAHPLGQQNTRVGKRQTKPRPTQMEQAIYTFMTSVLPAVRQLDRSTLHYPHNPHLHELLVLPLLKQIHHCVEVLLFGRLGWVGSLRTAARAVASVQ
eukprot:358199-Chlamydomonas_euryale.AAC.2